MASADEETKERIAKEMERQEDKTRKDYQRQAAREEGQSLKTESICQRLAKKADKTRIAAETTSDILIKILRHIFLSCKTSKAARL